MTCKRCNDMKPEGFDVDRLRKHDAEYEALPPRPFNPDEPYPREFFCSQCVGLAAQNIVDCVYRQLREIPTDALMRELARRFL